MDKELIIEPIVVGELQTNCYVLAAANSKQAFVIDPGAEAERIKELLENKDLKVKAVILTHGHYDHIQALDAFNVPVYIHKEDAEFLKDSMINLSASFGEDQKFDPDLKILEDEDEIEGENLKIEVLHTPGHTPGGICLKVGGVLFSGDTLFRHGIGRTDLPYGSYQKIKESILGKIFQLDDATIVFPGHGPATTLGEEKRDSGLL